MCPKCGHWNIVQGARCMCECHQPPVREARVRLEPPDTTDEWSAVYSCYGSPEAAYGVRDAS